MARMKPKAKHPVEDPNAGLLEDMDNSVQLAPDVIDVKAIAPMIELPPKMAEALEVQAAAARKRYREGQPCETPNCTGRLSVLSIHKDAKTRTATRFLICRKCNGHPSHPDITHY